MLWLIPLLALACGAGGGYYGYTRWGPAGVWGSPERSCSWWSSVSSSAGNVSVGSIEPRGKGLHRNAVHQSPPPWSVECTSAPAIGQEVQVIYSEQGGQWGASSTSARLCSALVAFRTDDSDAVLQFYRAGPINRVVPGSREESPGR